MLPFTTEEFLQVFEQDNEAVWPMQIVMIPLFWAAIGSSAAFLSGVWDDLGLLVAGLLGAVEVLRKSVHRRVGRAVPQSIRLRRLPGEHRWFSRKLHPWQWRPSEISPLPRRSIPDGIEDAVRLK